MTALLDVNVLMALIDGDHAHHAAATSFLQNLGPAGWATCPLTENGLLRILGKATALGGIGSPEVVRTHFRAWCDYRGHQFWPDDVSLIDARVFRSLSDSKHLTNLYLLGLAVKHGGRLATFDQHIPASLIPGGPAAYTLIPISPLISLPSSSSSTPPAL
jgi:toxin-antitoxin system PIN domain toxin